MKSELKPGVEREDIYVVEEKHTASFVGSGEASVLSTPSMIAMMERTARLAVEPMLGEGEITVGTRVDVQHLKPALVGSEVKVKAKLVKVEGRKLVFEVEAKVGDTVIGRGVHERYIVNRQRFLEKAKKLA